MKNEELLKIATRICKKSLEQIKFLIDNSDAIKKESGGMINLDKLDDYRSGITLVYLAGLNVGILEHTSLDTIFTFLDKGFFNEATLDFTVSSMNYVSKIKK
jgi:hypothetical protein